MKSITVDKLVSLILERLNETNDQYIFIDKLEKYPELYQPEESGQYSEPQYADKELALAEVNMQRNEVEKLPEPMRIPANRLRAGKRTQIPKIISTDPATGQPVEDMVISDVILIMPSGDRVLTFINLGEPIPRTEDQFERRYVVLPRGAGEENKYMADKPRSVKTGNPYVQPDLSEPENETPKDKEIRLERIRTIKEANAKRYGIFPTINDVFSKTKVMDHLDKCLIPEPWAGPNFTEHTTNRSILKTFGGVSPDIDCDFIAVRDLINVEDAINEVMDLRMALAGGPDEADNQGQRNREASKHMPRQHANYIYKSGGNWEAKQRVHDPEFFKKAGGKTPVYALLSKNIQEGLKTINVKSVLDIKGKIENNVYVLTGIFTSQLNCRNLTTGEGESTGPLFPPIDVTVTKPLPEDIDMENFSLEQNTDFFIDQGRTNSKISRTGFLPDFINKIGSAIVTNVDPDDVLQKMSQLVQMAVAEQ